MKKKRKFEYTKNDFEKDIMSRIKTDFLKKFQRLDEEFLVDRGKQLKAAIEPLLDTLSLDFDRRELRKAMTAPAVIIYRKTQPHPQPVCFIFVEFHFKRALLTMADNSSRILKKLFPSALAVYVALDKNPEKIRKKEFRNLDTATHSVDFEDCWLKLHEFLAENVFSIE